MSAPTCKVEIANFVCTFDEKPLLEQFERFYEAVSKPRLLEWRRGETTGYKFINVHMSMINNEIFLVGRLVKKIVHVSSQSENENQVSRHSQKMKDDPSSAFILRLYDHKIIIVCETKKAPKISDFQLAFNRLLKEVEHEDFQKELSKYKKKLDKKRLSAEEKANFDGWYLVEYPPFQLTITSIGSDKDVELIFKNVKLINTYIVKIPHSNDENPEVKNSFLKSLSKTRVIAGSDKTTSGEFTLKDNQIGLSKSFMKEVTADVGASGGMYGFHMIGKTNDDQKLNITENDIKVSYSIPSSLDVDVIAKNAVDKFEQFIQNGYVRLAKMVDEKEMLKKAKELFNKLKK